MLEKCILLILARTWIAVQQVPDVCTSWCCTKPKESPVLSPHLCANSCSCAVPSFVPSWCAGGAMVGWNQAFHWRLPAAVSPAVRPVVTSASKPPYPHLKCSSKCGLRENGAPHIKNVIPQRSNPSQHGESVETLQRRNRNGTEKKEGELWREVKVQRDSCGCGLCSLTDWHFEIFRVVRNVLIYKNVIWPLPCYWEPAQRGQFSSLGGECTKMGVKIHPHRNWTKQL